MIQAEALGTLAAPAELWRNRQRTSANNPRWSNQDAFIAHQRHHGEAGRLRLCQAARNPLFGPAEIAPLVIHIGVSGATPYAFLECDAVMKQRADIARLANRLRLATELAQVGSDKLREAADKAKIVHLQAGDVLWAEGERPQQLAFVLLGELAVERLHDDGQRKVFRRYRVNQVVGLSTVAGAPHSANIRAHVQSEVALLPGKLLLADAAFVSAAFESLARVIRALSDEYQALLYADIDERVRLYVRQAALDSRREITITQQELADEIGASRSNVARALGKLSKIGAVRLGHRGRIEIVDARQLGLDT